jgi:hypothetical protein
VDGVIDAVDSLVGAVVGGVKWLPYIVAGGVVAVVGFQFYNYHKYGKFYGEDTARDIVRAKTGLRDGYKYFPCPNAKNGRDRYRDYRHHYSLYYNNKTRKIELIIV